MAAQCNQPYCCAFRVCTSALDCPRHARNPCPAPASRQRTARRARSLAVPPDQPLGHAVHRTLDRGDRKSTRLNSSHSQISYAVFCLKKKKKKKKNTT